MNLRTLCILSMGWACALTGLTGCADSIYVKDPYAGTWKYDHVDEPEQKTLSYEARNGKVVKGLYATSGFVDSTAFVAYCNYIHNNGECDDWRPAILDREGNVTDLSDYELPTLWSCGGPLPILAYRDNRFYGNISNYSLSYEIPKQSDGLSSRYSFHRCGDVALAKSDYNPERILVRDRKTKLYGYINEKGEVVIPPKYKAATTYYSNGNAYIVNEEGRYGVIDVNGNFTPNEWACRDNKNDFFYYANKEGTINNYRLDSRFSGNEHYTSPDVEHEIDNCKDSTQPWHAIDKDGNILATGDHIQYMEPYKLFHVEIAGKFGYYKTDGTLLYEPIYKNVIAGERYFAVQNTDEKWAIGSATGAFLTDFEYDELSFVKTMYNELPYITSTYVILKANGKYGVFSEGSIIYDVVFDSINHFENGRATAKKDGVTYTLFLNHEAEREFYRQNNKMARIPRRDGK